MPASNSLDEIILDKVFLGCLKEKLSEEEQQYFLQQHYKYVINKDLNEYNIDLDEIFQIVGYTRKDSAIKCIRENLSLNQDYKLASPSSGANPHGGHNIKKFYFNLKGFTKLSISSNTEIGKKKRQYFVNLQEAINEYSLEYMKQYIIQIEQEKQQQKVKFEKVLLERDQLLSQYQKQLADLSGFMTIQENGWIYVIQQNNEILKHKQKFGRTVDIQDRMYSHSTANSDGITILFCTRCVNDSEAEKFIRNCHQKINCNYNREFVCCKPSFSICMANFCSTFSSLTYLANQHIKDTDLIQKFCTKFFSKTIICWQKVLADWFLDTFYPQDTRKMIQLRQQIQEHCNRIIQPCQKKQEESYIDQLAVGVVQLRQSAKEQFEVFCKKSKEQANQELDINALTIEDLKKLQDIQDQTYKNITIEDLIRQFMLTYIEITDTITSIQKTTICEYFEQKMGKIVQQNSKFARLLYSKVELALEQNQKSKTYYTTKPKGYRYIKLL